MYLKLRLVFKIYVSEIKQSGNDVQLLSITQSLVQLVISNIHHIMSNAKALFQQLYTVV
jgi:hypothetical protein